MFDVLYPLFSVFAFLGFVLALIPLPWHLQAWNSGTCFYMVWAALACLNQFANSVVWRDDTIDRAPVWCDLSIRITMAASVGIPAASLCINRRLYQIASVKTVSITGAEKRRSALIDALICVLFPLVYVAMQYIVQGHRYNIYEQIGCYPALYNSIPMYFISMMWPPLLGCVSAVYAILALRAFNARRIAFSQFLAPSTSSAVPGLTASRYLRLMALAVTAIILTTPLGIFAIWLNLTATPVGPWVSLSDTHFMFSRVEQIPAILWRGDRLLVIALEFTRWAAPATALVFFAFFGFAVEARKNYALFLGAIATAFWRALGRVGVRRPSSGFFAPRSTTARAGAGTGFKGIGYTKPQSVPYTPQAISLPAYSPRGPGSFTTASPSASSSHFTADLKRAESFASTSTATANSRFVERLPEHEDVSVSSVYSADAHVDVHVPASFAAVDTPASATSFASSATAGSAYALPLHVGWHEAAYPASPTSAGEHEPTEAWSPASDAQHSMIAVRTQQQQDTAARGRALA